MDLDERENRTPSGGNGTALAGPAAPGVFVREARKGDGETLWTLVRGLAEYSHLEHEHVSGAEDMERHFFAENPGVFALLAETADGKTLGFAVWYLTYSTFAGTPGAFLEDLFVLPRERRHGVGKALFQAFEAAARRRGCRRLEWRALGWNAPALEFYKRAGARVLENWLTFRKEL
ncbi:MAG: GNAT family N-acetyltransferase [Puniceicoccales bacterium]|nr:GNAT family N-acetyltransferase [Puniceicoccales bacterium]